MQVRTGFVTPRGAAFEDAAAVRGGSLGIAGSALRAAIAAALLCLCAQDLPAAATIRADADRIPAGAPAHAQPAGADRQGPPRHAARKGDAAAAAGEASGRPLLDLVDVLYRGSAPAPLVSFIRARSAALAGIVAAWLAFEILLLAVRVREARGAVE